MTVLMDIEPGEPVGLLTSGAEVRQDILIGPADDPPADAMDATVCVRAQFVNTGRDTVGALDVTVATDEVSRTSRVDVAAIRDWDVRSFCLALPAEGPTLEGLSFVVRRTEAEPDGSPERTIAVLGAAAQPMVPSAVFLAPELDDRAVVLGVPLSLRVTLEYRSPRAGGGVGGALVTGAEGAVLWLPRLIALLVLVLIAIRTVRVPDRATARGAPAA